jgi:Cu/Ag efflux protein CusF
MRLLLVVVVGSLAACSDGVRGEGERAVQRYEMRGEVTRLPSAGMEAVDVRHEAVPGFVDMDGQAVGMTSMTMPFPLGDGVELDGIEPGDKVDFTLEVEWDGDPPYRIIRIEKLPADTMLDFGR